MPCPRNRNSQRDQQPLGFCSAGAQARPMPRAIVEFPEPLTADWADPAPFPQARSLHMSAWQLITPARCSAMASRGSLERAISLH